MFLGGMCGSGYRGVCGFKVQLAGGVEQAGSGGKKGDGEAVEHVAGDDGGGKLDGLLGAEVVLLEELARGFKHGRVEGLLDDARGLLTEAGAGQFAVFGADVAGAFALEESSGDLNGGDGGDEFCVVLNGLKQGDERLGARLLHEELDEGGGIEKTAALDAP